MRAAARIVAEADGRGGTRLPVLRGEPPLLLRRTGPARGPATVHLVGGAAGPLSGDDLRLDVEVGPGARLDVRAVAATLALPGRPAAPPSVFEVRASVAARATLCWLPEPLIAAAGCDHRAVARVEVADGGCLLWRDDLACGRHGEPTGDLHADVTIRYAGATLYRHQLAVGARAPGWSGAAVLGAATLGGSGTAARCGSPGDGHAMGSVVLARPDPPATHRAAADFPGVGQPRAEAAVMALAGPGVLATAIGPDIRSVRAALDPWCAAQLRDLEEFG
ncbi:urease accessory protein UreD [Krasilnikovia sp. M28-CT-15]|uniref:urease accessory protein UreD n=1 Tax=Krasilnikovia sp. M28-CT-15 TaxID=3373540 RepID=UPI003876EB36